MADNYTAVWDQQARFYRLGSSPDGTKDIRLGTEGVSQYASVVFVAAAVVVWPVLLAVGTFQIPLWLSPFAVAAAAVRRWSFTDHKRPHEWVATAAAWTVERVRVFGVRVQHPPVITAAVSAYRRKSVQ